MTKKFAMYLVCLDSGEVFGSNDVELIKKKADELAEGGMIIHASNGHVQASMSNGLVREALVVDLDFEEDNFTDDEGG